MYSLHLLFLLLCLGHDLVNSQKTENDGPSDLCIGCICEAASRCDRTLLCDHDMCGMFRITRPYWEDAGKPVIHGDTATDVEAWKRCVTDPFCAGQTVFGYMKKYKKDCTGDGKITCHDYAHLHHLGPFGCGQRALDFRYKEEFDSCMKDGERT